MDNYASLLYFYTGFGCAQRLNIVIIMLYLNIIILNVGRRLTLIAGVNIKSPGLALKVCQRME